MNQGSGQSVPAVTRQLCLAVLLALLIGHATYIAHTATHPIGDLAHCELCTAHSNTMTVASPPATLAPDLSALPVIPPRTAFLAAATPWSAASPRGPPRT
ncbi:MAG TPA: hypothetical protein VIS31_02580 [Woeseiaceae bacterium]